MLFNWNLKMKKFKRQMKKEHKIVKWNCLRDIKDHGILHNAEAPEVGEPKEIWINVYLMEN